MAKYNINQIEKFIDKLKGIGIKTEKAILDMKIEDLEKLPRYTLTDIKTLITIRKIATENRKALVIFLGDEETS